MLRTIKTQPRKHLVACVIHSAFKRTATGCVVDWKNQTEEVLTGTQSAFLMDEIKNAIKNQC